MNVIITSNSLDISDAGLTKGAVLRCYRQEKVASIQPMHYFLCECPTFDDNVYVTSPDDYEELVFHDPELPANYSKGNHVWLSETDVQVFSPLNNKNAVLLLEPENL